MQTFKASFFSKLSLQVLEQRKTQTLPILTKVAQNKCSHALMCISVNTLYMLRHYTFKTSYWTVPRDIKFEVSKSAGITFSPRTAIWSVSPPPHPLTVSALKPVLKWMNFGFANIVHGVRQTWKKFGKLSSFLTGQQTVTKLCSGSKNLYSVYSGKIHPVQQTCLWVRLKAKRALLWMRKKLSQRKGKWTTVSIFHSFQRERTYLLTCERCSLEPGTPNDMVVSWITLWGMIKV